LLVADSRHRQLSRIYQRPIEDDNGARAVVNMDPGTLASAIFLEAVESDDVTSIESARVYFEDRLAFLGTLVEPGVTALVRSDFEARLHAWE
jgi:hypothetical protein